VLMPALSTSVELIYAARGEKRKREERKGHPGRGREKNVPRDFQLSLRKGKGKNAQERSSSGKEGQARLWAPGALRSLSKKKRKGERGKGGRGCPRRASGGEFRIGNSSSLLPEGKEKEKEARRGPSNSARRLLRGSESYRLAREKKKKRGRKEKGVLRAQWYRPIPRARHLRPLKRGRRERTQKFKFQFCPSALFK